MKLFKKRWRVSDSENTKAETIFWASAKRTARRTARQTNKIQYIEKLVNSL
jgi:hypothetical protein